MATGSLTDTQRSARPEDSANNSKMLVLSPRKSIQEVTRETGLSFHTIRSVPTKELNCQSLSAEDCNIHMSFGGNMLTWYEDWPDLFKNHPPESWSCISHQWGFWNVTTAGEDPLPIAERNSESPKSNRVMCDDFGQDLGSIHSSPYHDFRKLPYHAVRWNLAIN